jgi:hypothetical protein
MSISIASLKDTLTMHHLPFEEMLRQFAPALESEDQEELYRDLEALAEMIGQRSKEVASLRQWCDRMNQIEKAFLWQRLAEATPEEVINLYRDAKETAQPLCKKVSIGREILKEIRSKSKLDPIVAELFPPEKIALLNEVIDTSQFAYELHLRSLSWIEEYMRSVVQQTQLPSWVGSVSIGADSSDHHLG